MSTIDAEQYRLMSTEEKIDYLHERMDANAEAVKKVHDAALETSEILMHFAKIISPVVTALSMAMDSHGHDEDGIVTLPDEIRRFYQDVMPRPPADEIDGESVDA